MVSSTGNIDRTGSKGNGLCTGLPLSHLSEQCIYFHSHPLAEDPASSGW